MVQLQKAALALIKDAQEKKLISKGGTVVEGTAGNTGIGLGLLGNSLGYKTIIVMNDNQTQEKKDTPVVITSRSDEAPARLASIAAAVVALD